MSPRDHPRSPPVRDRMCFVVWKEQEKISRLPTRGNPQSSLVWCARACLCLTIPALSRIHILSFERTLSFLRIQQGVPTGKASFLFLSVPLFL
jgi:hypothetical protein